MDKLSMEGGFFSGFNANHDASMEQRGTLKQQSLRPVTIKQLTELQLPQSDDATLLCDGYPLNSITFVAVLRNMRDMPNCHLLQLEDGTGAINARIWVERLDETTRTRIQQLPLNDYVRVYGTPRSSNGSLQVFLHQVLPINDYNEVTMHLLETINTHLYYTRGAVS
jgi:replication factor A2